MGGSPVIVPQSQAVLFDAKTVFEQRFMQMAVRPDYTSFTRLCGRDDPAGDLIRVFYTNPVGPMPEFKGPRHRLEVNLDYFDQTVRTFASGIAFNVFDAMPDAGTPLKVQAYLQANERLGESAALLYPSLFNQAIITGLTKKWGPDGANFWGLHYIDPRRPSLGTNRNYYANNANGGNQAMPITYGNVLKVLKAGRGWKVPGGSSGQQRAVIYDKWATNPTNAPLLRRLLTVDRVPSWEAAGQTAGSTNAGGDVPNEIRQYWGGSEAQVEEVANMPEQYWMGLDTRSPSEMTFRVKERLPVIWQSIGSLGMVLPFPTPEGVVSEQVYRTMETEYGPLARGEIYMANIHAAVLCDSTP